MIGQAAIMLSCARERENARVYAHSHTLTHTHTDAHITRTLTRIPTLPTPVVAWHSRSPITLALFSLAFAAKTASTPVVPRALVIRVHEIFKPRTVIRHKKLFSTPYRFARPATPSWRTHITAPPPRCTARHVQRVSTTPAHRLADGCSRQQSFLIDASKSTEYTLCRCVYRT